MTNWITEPGLVRPEQHISEMTIGPDLVAEDGFGRRISFGTVGDRIRLDYEAAEPPFAEDDDGIDFPVAFDLCITVGDQTISARPVCQPKPTGMLCHL
ncbi:MAG: hypothetical protein KatS3mg076_1332 [Candidatus Binatia bacterium]|nr:MAG: hypothetical protein KatS3mg076_1332 [Candidatus Binatia bacterium]